MGRHQKSTRFIALLAGACAIASQASAQHWAHQEAPLHLLFKDAPSRDLREINSRAATPLPVLTFRKSLTLNSNGEARVGKSCLIRDVSLVPNSGKGYFSSALAKAPGGFVHAGESFEMGLLSARFESIRFELISKEKPSRRFEIGCTDANIQGWTLSDFESSASQTVSVKVAPSLTGIRPTGKQAVPPSTQMKDLKGYRFNGVFGSGLPGTSGVQLLFGANLKAYSDETGASLMQGRRCRIKAQTARSLNDRYIKGSKFSFLGFLPKPQSGTVELVFANWNHSPHQIQIECLGDERSVRDLALRDIESDLNDSIRFYKK
jgi:hypothetical protein